MITEWDWDEHKKNLEGKISKQARQVLDFFTVPSNIGFEQGQVRPGELGQYDVFYMSLEWGLTEDERRLISGLPTEALVEMEIEKANDQFHYEFIQTLSQKDLEKFISQLEENLA